MKILATIALLALPIAQSPGPAVTTLSPVAIKTLAGCWSPKADPNRWFFRPHGTSGLDAAIESTGIDGTRRLGSPFAVMFDATHGSYGFRAVGPNHPLLVIFTIEGSQLKAAYYSQHNPTSGYHWTGDSAVLDRCPP